MSSPGRAWRSGFGASDVIDVLTALFILRGAPAFVRSDNSPEFVAAVGARTAFIESGSPWGSVLNSVYLVWPIGVSDTVRR